MSRIFIDANIPMYVAGRDHPLKETSTRILKLAAARPESFFTDAEVLQELLHRYLALRRTWPSGRRATIDFAELMRGRIEPIYGEDVERAASLAEKYAPPLAARDLLHAAVMLRVGTEKIATADTDFDHLAPEGIVRLDPMDVEEWGGEISSGENGS